MNDKIASGNKYFPNTVKNIEKYNKLTENIETDIVIVGGGLVAAITAYYLTKLGRKIIVLEKAKIAMASSSIATCLLQYELEDLILDLEKNYTEEEIMKFYNFGHEALNNFNNMMNDTKIDCDYKVCDSLLYTDSIFDIKRLNREYEVRKKHGYKVELVNENNSIFSFKLLKGIIAKNGGGVINPTKFTVEMFRFLNDKNVTVYENTEVKTYVSEKNKTTVTTSNGSIVECCELIIATGYCTNAFMTKRYGHLSTTYNVVTHVIEELTQWEKSCILKSCEIPYTYIRTTADNRLIIGGMDTKFVPSIASDTVASAKYVLLEDKLKEMFPELKIKAEYSYYGAFVTTKNNMPYIGRDKKHVNVYYIFAYGGNGVISATGGAEVLLKLMSGEKSNYYDCVKLNR